jgi:hypothetical protein
VAPKNTLRKAKLGACPTVSTSANLEVATKDDKAKQIHALGRELKNALMNAKYIHQQNEHLMPQAK